MDRLTSGSLQDLLGRAGPAIAAGTVTVISVKAIRGRSGDRWDRKQEQVQQFLERSFARLAARGDLIVQLNDVEFITIQGAASRRAALGVAATLLRETLSFFLGAATREDLELFQVTGFSNGSLAVEPIDLNDPSLTAGSTPHEAEAQRQPIAPPSSPFDFGKVRTLRLSGSVVPEVEATFGTSPVWNIQSKAIASHLQTVTLASIAPDGARTTLLFRQLSPNLASEVAAGALADAASMIRTGTLRAAAHVCIPSMALTYSTSRYRLLHALRALPDGYGGQLILELVDLEDGFPPSRLKEHVAMLARHGRAVLARAPHERADVRNWRRCGLSGVTLDTSHLDPEDRSAQARLGSFAMHAAETAKACVAYGLASRSMMLTAWAAGFTHLSSPALQEAPMQHGGLVRFEPTDLYKRPTRAA